MKKTIILAVLVALALPTMAQTKDNVFSITHEWSKYFGYSYQPGYPYGFSLAGGSFMSVGFSDGKEYTITPGVEKRVTTWSMRFGWIGYNFDKKKTGMGAISFRPYVALGMNFAKDSISKDGGLTWTGEGNTYFTVAPSIVVNLYLFHFSVGYEIVPAFKELNGINFGVGISFPNASGSVSSKAKTATKNATTRRRTTKKK